MPGARVILSDGELMGWLARGGHHLVTFLPKDKAEAALRAAELAKALAQVAARRFRSMVIATIDGVPAPESACARAFAEHGFAARQGALVRLAGEGGNARLGARSPPVVDDQAEDVDDDLAEMEDDLEELDALTSLE
jgi:hypothetical protein